MSTKKSKISKVSKISPDEKKERQEKRRVDFSQSEKKRKPKPSDLLRIGAKFEKYTIDKKIVNSVYRVVDSEGQKFAMKVEGPAEDSDEEEEKYNKKFVKQIKMEVLVLRKFCYYPKSRHFCIVHDYGRLEKFNFLVMQLVGRSLADLKKSLKSFSIGCSISMGIQSLEAIQDLHNFGFLHRDIQPANFAIGLSGEIRKLYMLDFGTARNFVMNDGVIRKPRQAAAFRGTLRFAPLSSHLQRELCRKDDVESWLYMLVVLACGQLPWHHVTDRNQVEDAKKSIRNCLHILFSPPCPPEFQEIYKNVDKLKYYDQPHYEGYFKLLRDALQTVGSSEEASYDWEKEGPAAELLKK